MINKVSRCRTIVENIHIQTSRLSSQHSFSTHTYIRSILFSALIVPVLRCNTRAPSLELNDTIIAIMSTNTDGSESVDQFLARIAATPKGLDDDKRRADEEFLRNRQERQARRLGMLIMAKINHSRIMLISNTERARSISPSKTGPAASSTLSVDSLKQSTTTAVLSPPIDFSPQAKLLGRSNAISGRMSPTKSTESPSPQENAQTSNSAASMTASGLARSGTLSWQQRPVSRDGAKARPVSAFMATRSPPPESPTSPNCVEPSRKEIAASLAQKDPNWFKQTQERGQNSAAYRKNQVEDTPRVSTARSMQLPGMARSHEPSESPAPEPLMTLENDRFRRGITPDIAALRLSMAEKPPQLRPSNSDMSHEQSASTDSQGQSIESQQPMDSLSRTRSGSPTKGLGGFVESAMMRRSDSVNKRWSVRAAPGLKRGDSVLGGRPTSLHSRTLSRDADFSRALSPSSPTTISRPASSHRPDINLASEPLHEVRNVDMNEHVPNTLRRNGSQKDNEDDDSRPHTPVNDVNLPRSPSKTMDPRRWSPTKSTWLESALQQKQETPNMQPARDDTPKWKVDLQRSRSMRASRDVSPEKKAAARLSRPETEDPSPSPEVQIKSNVEASSLAVPAASQPVKRSTPMAVSRKSTPAIEPEIVNKTQPSPPIEEKPVLTSQSPVHVKRDSESVRPPPIVKPKPQTPPKIDFRSTLRSRAADSGPARQNEPEFKSVFGKLKRTTTQNYVAPDELKHNILSGKAALATTGGPVKSQRVDEFKESILAKKDEMRQAPVSQSDRPEMKPKPATVVPEALARRKTLSRASAPVNLTAIQPAAKPSSISTTLPSETPASTGGRIDEGERAMPIERPTTAPQKPVRAGPDTSTGRDMSEPLSKQTSAPESRFQPVKPVIDQSSVRSFATPTPSNIPNPTRKLPEPPTTEQSTPFATSQTGNKLAGRINPNLAAMLFRGGSPRPAGVTSSDAGGELGQTTSPSKQSSEPVQLEHKTKARAKGPKRRAPKTEPPSTNAPVTSQKPEKTIPPPLSSTQAKSETVTQAKSTPALTSTAELSPGSSALTTRTSIAPLEIAKTLQTRPQQDLEASHQTTSSVIKESSAQESLVQAKSAIASPKIKPTPAAKSAELRRVSGTASPVDTKPKAQELLKTPQKPEWSIAQRTGGSETTVTPSIQPVKIDRGDARPSVQETGKPKSTGPLLSPFVKIKKQDVTPMKPVVEEKKSSLTPAPLSPTKQRSVVETPSALSTPVRGLGLKMTPSPQKFNQTPQPKTLTPPPDVKHTSLSSEKIRAVLEGYVGNIPKEHEKADFDASSFLASTKFEENKVKTTASKVFEITGNGNKSTMPPQQEHILYEDSMYLIIHNFTTPTNASSAEVVLWCGDRVSDASIEDTQIFCRKDAREHGSKLDVIKQGRETANLIQALGGILITRRSKHSTSFMLCGRQYFGHIVFDEVNLTSASLCPGFAYLLASSQSKSYLWKGKGASADEVGCARLIAMDLTSAGEVVEIEQGKETSSFWHALGAKEPQTWSNDWERRHETKAHPIKLYRVEHERPGMLTNLASWGLKRGASPAKQNVKVLCQQIEPFTQNDLDNNAVHILDAYRNLYVLVNRNNSSKSAEFLTALFAAQDIAMLASAIQDRPSLPTCYVVAGELSSDIKACFRKWNAMEATSLMGREMLNVRLDDVIEALELR